MNSVGSSIIFAFVIVCTNACALAIYNDDTPIQDAHIREQLDASVKSLKDQPLDVNAINAIIGFFGEKHVQLTGTSVMYGSKDEIKSNAYAVLRDPHSIECLCNVISEGTDLSARWAILRAENQLLNSDNDSKEPYVIRLRDVHGFFDEDAKMSLREVLRHAIDTRTGATRAAALSFCAQLLPQQDRQSFRMKFVDDKDEVVAAAAIAGFAERNGTDDQVLPRVWKYLARSENEALLTACCTYLWLAERERTQSFDEHLADFQRLARHPSARVRHDLANALEAATTHEHPKFIEIMIQLAGDKDELVRHNAVRSLRYAKTPEVLQRVREYFNESQPQLVRLGAFEILAEFGTENEQLIIGAATDKNVAVRSQATYYLRKLASENSIRTLEGMLQDEDEHVRKSAEREWEWVKKEPSRSP